MTDEYLRIGTVTKPHGLKGALKVFPTTDDNEKFNAGQRVFIAYRGEMLPVVIKNASRFKKLFITTFEEYSDINEVEIFKGCDIMIEKPAEDDLSENEYYIDDLVGMRVEDELGNELGTLFEVMTTGANDVYVVTSEEREILLPAIHECILDVSVEEKRMKVHLMPGLV